jgi:hypothetical protein
VTLDGRLVLDNNINPLRIDVAEQKKNDRWVFFFSGPAGFCVQDPGS